MAREKKILALGPNLYDYARNKVLLDVFSGQFDLTKVQIRENLFGQMKLLWTLLREGSRADYVLFLHPTIRFSFGILLTRLFVRKPYIGDAFISMFDTLVSDRELAKPHSLKGYYYYLLDVLYVRSVDVLIFDTPEHEEYFKRTFGIPPKVKIFVLPITIDTKQVDSISPALPAEISDVPGKQTVLFFGNYIPLQGVPYIIEAISQFRDQEDVRFLMVGNGQTRHSALKQAKELGLENVQFVASIARESVIALVKKCDVSLGIFGHTDKAARVIPNKVLEAMAAGVPVVSGRSAPMERYFKEGVHIFYAHLGNADDIARAIRTALGDIAKRSQIAKEARVAIDAEFSKERLAERISEMKLALQSM